MSTLSLSFLGSFEASLNGEAIIGFQSDKARALLAYLVIEANRPHSRSYLSGLLWPEWSESEARRNLRHALANLRKILNDPDSATSYLIPSHQTIQFSMESGHQCDVADFFRFANLSGDREAMDIRQSWERAINLYRGPFLQGFFLADCSHFEEWILRTRVQYHQQAIDILGNLTSAYEEQDEPEQAIDYARRLVALEPLHEESQYKLIRLLALSGHQNIALRQYNAYCQLLNEELNCAPTNELVLLYKQIKTGRLSRTLNAVKHSESISRSSTKNESSVKADVAQHNLPSELNSFIGRKEEIEYVHRLFCTDGIRLVTLNGPGGIGKTRLALQIARTLLHDFADGTFFVSLATVRSANLVPSAIAEVLSIRETGIRPLREKIKAFLAGKEMLLILDNFEHVIDAAPLVTELLESSSLLKVLVTSREVLHLRGENEYLVPSMTVPSFVLEDASDNVAQYEAVRLFAQRALNVRAAFKLDDENVVAVADICRRLDGLPLAIELAAARMKFFTPQSLFQHLFSSNEHSAMQLLKRENRDVPNRHRSIRATIAWSHDLLEEEEQIFLRRLAIFEGSFMLDAVEQICVTDLAFSAIDGIASLIDKSLLRQMGTTDNEPRFVLLEIVREFGLEQLERSCERAALKQRHIRYYVALIVTLQPRLRGPQSGQARILIIQELPNIRATFRWALAEQNLAACMQLCDSLLSFWNGGYAKEAEGYVQETISLAKDCAPSISYVHTLVTAGFVAYSLGKFDASKCYFKSSLAMNEEIGYLGMTSKMGIANGLLALNMVYTGDYQAARAYLERELQYVQGSDDERALAMHLVHKGHISTLLGDFETANRLLSDALMQHKQVGQTWGIAMTLATQGYLYVQQNKLDEANKILLQSQELYDEIQAPEGAILRSLGMIALKRANFAEAERLLNESLVIEYELGVLINILETLETMLQVAIQQNAPLHALRLAGAISAQRDIRGLVIPPLDKAVFDNAVLDARGQLTQDVASEAWRKGESFSLHEVVQYALSGSFTQ